MHSTTHVQRAWIRLPSGRHLDLINPDPKGWDDTDLAIRLSRTYRWGGESRWPEPLSVAQHSLLVWRLRVMNAATQLTPAQARLELLHDAEEAFLGVDMISPLKAVLGQPFKQVSDRLFEAIRERYALPAWDAESLVSHKLADTIAAASEAVHCVGWSHDEVKRVLGISVPAAKHDPLADIYGTEPWVPWPASVAAARFMEALRSHLQDDVDND